MLTLFACRGCGLVLFPARRLCHRCGGDAWDEVPCAGGVAEAVTVLRRAVDQGGPPGLRLAAVRTPQDVVIIAGLAEPAAAGSMVRLEEAPGGAVTAHLDLGRIKEPPP